MATRLPRGRGGDQRRGTKKVGRDKAKACDQEQKHAALQSWCWPRQVGTVYSVCCSRWVVYVPFYLKTACCTVRTPHFIGERGWQDMLWLHGKIMKNWTVYKFFKNNHLLSFIKFHSNWSGIFSGISESILGNNKKWFISNLGPKHGVEYKNRWLYQKI